MVLEQGSWEHVELTVKRWSETRKQELARGGFVTKQWLIDNRSYTKCSWQHHGVFAVLSDVH